MSHLMVNGIAEYCVEKRLTPHGFIFIQSIIFGTMGILGAFIQVNPLTIFCVMWALFTPTYLFARIGEAIVRLSDLDAEQSKKSIKLSKTITYCFSAWALILFLMVSF